MMSLISNVYSFKFFIEPLGCLCSKEEVGRMPRRCAATIPLTLYNNLSRFRDTDKEFELQRDLLKLITNKNYNVDLATLPDKNPFYDFSKEMYFDEKALSNKSTSDKSFIRLL